MGVGLPAVRTGTSFTGLTTMVKVRSMLVLSFGALVSPLSVRTTLNVAVPKVLRTALYVSVPVAALMVGCWAKSRLWVGVPTGVTVKVSVWLDSSLGPVTILVAKLGTVTTSASSFTVL